MGEETKNEEIVKREKERERMAFVVLFESQGSSVNPTLSFLSLSLSLSFGSFIH